MVLDEWIQRLPVSALQVTERNMDYYGSGSNGNLGMFLRE